MNFRMSKHEKRFGIKAITKYKTQNYLIFILIFIKNEERSYSFNSAKENNMSGSGNPTLPIFSKLYNKCFKRFVSVPLYVRVLVRSNIVRRQHTQRVLLLTIYDRLPLQITKVIMQGRKSYT